MSLLFDSKISSNSCTVSFAVNPKLDQAGSDTVLIGRALCAALDLASDPVALECLSIQPLRKRTLQKHPAFGAVVCWARLDEEVRL
jgi:hypothetical protein